MSSCASGACADAPAADAEQLDFAVQGRILAIVQRAHHVVRRRQRLVPVQLPARQADQMRRIQPCVLRVDRHEHLHDVIFGQAVENDGWHREIVLPHVVDVGVEREQPVLAVDRAQDALALRNLESADDRARLDRLET